MIVIFQFQACVQNDVLCLEWDTLLVSADKAEGHGSLGPVLVSISVWCGADRSPCSHPAGVLMIHLAVDCRYFLLIVLCFTIYATFSVQRCLLPVIVCVYITGL